MNISKQLKNYRKEFKISQEELAEVIHVSRQTISNWENGKSYPDLQSLLLLSDYFKISLDELVKGDVVNMKKELEPNEMRKLGNYSWISGALMFATIPFIEKFKFIVALTLTFMFLMLWFAFKIEKIKKDKDLKTYSEILAYMKNKEIPQIAENERRKKVIIQNIGLPLVSAIVSGLLAYIMINL